jgi:DNA-binding Xre family transcriptional regulator
MKATLVRLFMGMKIAITIELPELEKKLKTWRDAKGWSLNDLSRQITLEGKRMTSQNIQRIETGETKAVPYETLQTICNALGVDLMPQIAEAIQTQIIQGRSR